MSYTVERTIEDVEFGGRHVDEIRESVKKDMVEDGVTITETRVENRLRERLKEIANDRTLNEQGDNRLHHSIDHGDVTDE